MSRLSSRDYVIDLVKVSVNNSGDVINLSSFNRERGKSQSANFTMAFNMALI